MATSPTELATAAAISVPYASQILKGRRKPSLAMALQIYERTGQRFGVLVEASEDDIAAWKRLQDAA